MADDSTDIAKEYLEAVFARAQTPIAPPGFAPDWADQPFRYKTYPEAERVALPMDVPERLAGLDGLPALSAVLQLSYGLLARRLDVNANSDELGRCGYPNAVW